MTEDGEAKKTLTDVLAQEIDKQKEFAANQAAIQRRLQAGIMPQPPKQWPQTPPNFWEQSKEEVEEASKKKYKQAHFLEFVEKASMICLEGILSNPDAYGVQGPDQIAELAHQISLSLYKRLYEQKKEDLTSQEKPRF